MSPEPPTMALLGMTPKGGKKACMEPPSPVETGGAGEDLGQRAVEHIVDGQLLDRSPSENCSTTRSGAPSM
jgi:hypothetical protein